jgi:hypothetical protein
MWRSPNSNLERGYADVATSTRKRGASLSRLSTANQAFQEESSGMKSCINFVVIRQVSSLTESPGLSSFHCIAANVILHRIYGGVAKQTSMKHKTEEEPEILVARDRFVISIEDVRQSKGEEENETSQTRHHKIPPLISVLTEPFHSATLS